MIDVINPKTKEILMVTNNGFNRDWIHKGYIPLSEYEARQTKNKIIIDKVEEVKGTIQENTKKENNNKNNKKAIVENGGHNG